MKRLIVGALAVIAFGFAAGLTAAAQSADAQGPSLGDYARTVRKTKLPEPKSAEKVYDNDNIASSTSVSVVGKSSTPSDSNINGNGSKEADAAGSNGNGDSKAQSTDAPKVMPGESREERQKVFDSWKQRIDEQRQKIDRLSHEINDLKNVNNSQVSVWPDQKYAQTLTDKEKALEDAKSGLTDLQEQARKAGVPSSITE